MTERTVDELRRELAQTFLAAIIEAERRRREEAKDGPPSI